MTTPNYNAYLAILAPIGAEIERALKAHDMTLQLPVVHEAYKSLRTRIEADMAIDEETRMASNSEPCAKRMRLIDVYDSDADEPDIGADGADVGADAKSRRATGTSMTPFLQLLRKRDSEITRLEYKCIRLETANAHLQTENIAINDEFMETIIKLNKKEQQCDGRCDSSTCLADVYREIIDIPTGGTPEPQTDI